MDQFWALVHPPTKWSFVQFMDKNTQHRYIPNNCPFWYITILFWRLENTPKNMYIREKYPKPVNITRYAKKYTSSKKYTTAGCVVVTNMSYEHRKGLEGVIPLHEQNLHIINRGSPQTPVKFGLQTGLRGDCFSP